VGDNTSGTPEKNMAKIFDPFYTKKEVGKGTGLGLSISKKIVFELRGRREAYNNKHDGVIFFITACCKAICTEV
jgi:C4-dicarboxylate-specific signal transduction histidine kinase